MRDLGSIDRKIGKRAIRACARIALLVEGESICQKRMVRLNLRILAE